MKLGSFLKLLFTLTGRQLSIQCSLHRLHGCWRSPNVGVWWDLRLSRPQQESQRKSIVFFSLSI